MNKTTISQPTSKHRWPEGAIVYHIYPRSLQDSNGDGVGDLNGITQRLDYLKELGVQVIWLSPFYPSPMIDFGYDVADYCNIDPMFGTLDDFKILLKEAHRRHIHVLVDLVANHTSDEHAWFQESRQSKDNTKSNWYIWKDGRTDAETGQQLPPNNWRDALAGNSAWAWDDHRQQYYLHSWHARQPDLNWSNKAVRHAIKDVMRFWLDLGVDGFRADAVDWIAKDPLFRDDGPSPDYQEGDDSPYDALDHQNSRGWPTEYAYLAEMTSVFEEEKYRHKELFLIAETYQERHNPAESYVAFYGGLDPELAAPFNFEGLYLGWEAQKWRRFLRAFHNGLADISPFCVPSYAFGNHDNPRVVTRLGEAVARSCAVMQLTLPGLIFIYYGEEIGMKNVELPAEVMRDTYYRSRDPERTPMQWSADKNAGFSSADSTWLPVASDYQSHNVATQTGDPTSFLSLYRALGQLRQGSKCLRWGRIDILDVDNDQVLGYTRRHESEAYLVLVNFSGDAARVTCDISAKTLIISTHQDTTLKDISENGVFQLLPHEAALFFVA